LEKKIFATYRQKILEGKVDPAQLKEPDVLWGEG
jgi:hypothetical protein